MRANGVALLRRVKTVLIYAQTGLIAIGIHHADCLVVGAHSES